MLICMQSTSVRIDVATKGLDWDLVERARSTTGLKGYVTNINLEQMDGAEVVAAYQSVTDWHRRRPADPVVPAAGARSLLGSLWLLDDEAALDLMEGYYARLAAGETKAAALRALWREWIAHPEPHKRHPFYWGALQLVGDGGPL